LFLNRQRRIKKGRRDNRGPKPLYLQKHVAETADRFVTIGFGKEFKLNSHISLTFIEAGHLLGAAAAIIRLEENGITKTIGFSGDVGRENYPILRNPAKLPPLDYLVCESTYGGRFHSKYQTIESMLIETIREAC